jgi:rhamnogalacturonan hydrolase
VGRSRSRYAATKMPNDLAAGFAITASTPIPTTFFSGASPASALLG